MDDSVLQQSSIMGDDGTSYWWKIKYFIWTDFYFSNLWGSYFYYPCFVYKEIEP